MEFEVSSIFILLSCFVFVFILSKNNKPKLNLPPGPRKFPFIGNLHLLAGSDLHHHTLRDLAEKYGPLMHLKLGEVDNVIVSSPEIAKEFLKTHDLVFASRPSLLVTEIGCYGSTDVAFAPYGEYWRQMRRIFMLELLNAKRVQLFRPIREEEVLDLCKWIALHAGSTIDLTQKLVMTNLDIMARAALGKKTDDQATLIALIGEGAKLNPVSNIVDVYPSIKFLSLFSRRKLEKYRRQLGMISDNIIEQHKQAGATKSNDEGKHNDHDLLDVLLKLQGDGSLEIPLTTDNIKVVLVDLFGAGVESLSSTVDWAMAEMLKKPRVLKWAQDEVRNVFDGKNHVVDECYFC